MPSKVSSSAPKESPRTQKRRYGDRDVLESVVRDCLGFFLSERGRELEDRYQRAKGSPRWKRILSYAKEELVEASRSLLHDRWTSDGRIVRLPAKDVRDLRWSEPAGGASTRSRQAYFDLLALAEEIEGDGPDCYSRPERQRAHARLRDAVVHDPSNIQCAGGSIAWDSRKLRPIVRRSPEVLRYLSDELRSDRDLVITAVQRESLVLKWMSEELRSDQDVVRAAVASPLDGSLGFAYASSSLKGNAAFAAHSVRTVRKAVRWIAPAFLHDVEFLRSAVTEDPLLLELLPEDAVRKLLAHHPTLAERWNAVREDLSNLNISFSARLQNGQVVREVIRNRTTDARDRRPLAVGVFPKKDWNNSFEVNGLAQLVTTHRLMYYEASTDDEFLAACKDAVARAGHLISHLIVAGHGTATSLSLGDESGRKTDESDETLFLDVGDAEKLDRANFSSLFSHEADVVLQSCAGGEGGSSAPNLANFFADRVPLARIFSQASSSRAWTMLSKKGRVKEYGVLSGHGYVIDPKAKRAARRRRLI